jgi:hypothetical protein
VAVMCAVAGGAVDAEDGAAVLLAVDGPDAR